MIITIDSENVGMDRTIVCAIRFENEYDNFEFSAARCFVGGKFPPDLTYFLHLH